MKTLAKGMIGLSALIAAGYVGMGSLTNARPTPASVIFNIDIPAPASEGVDLTSARRDAAAALASIVPRDGYDGQEGEGVIAPSTTAPRPGLPVT